MYANEEKEFKVTMLGELADYKNPKWKKLGEMEGKYAKDDLKIMGFFTKHNDFAPEDAKGLDKVNIYLILKRESTEENFFVRVPHSLGVKIIEDRNNNSNLDIETYLECASIKEIRTFKTKYGTKSATYTLW